MKLDRIIEELDDMLENQEIEYLLLTAEPNSMGCMASGGMNKFHICEFMLIELSENDDLRKDLIDILEQVASKPEVEVRAPKVEIEKLAKLLRRVDAIDALESQSAN